MDNGIFCVDRVRETYLKISRRWASSGTGTSSSKVNFARTESDSFSTSAAVAATTMTHPFLAAVRGREWMRSATFAAMPGASFPSVSDFLAIASRCLMRTRQGEICVARSSFACKTPNVFGSFSARMEYASISKRWNAKEAATEWRSVALPVPRLEEWTRIDGWSADAKGDVAVDKSWMSCAEYGKIFLS